MKRREKSATCTWRPVTDVKTLKIGFLNGKRNTTREPERGIPGKIRSDKKIRIVDQRPFNRKKDRTKKSGTLRKKKFRVQRRKSKLGLHKTPTRSIDVREREKHLKEDKDEG